MLEGGSACHFHIALVAPPGGIVVPAGNIHRTAQRVVVKAGEGVHHVGGYGNIGRNAAQGFDLRLEETHQIIAGKTPPCQQMRHVLFLAEGAGADDLLKAAVLVGPEAVPPCAVQVFDGAVACPAPVAETLLTARAVTVVVVLVGYMPHHQRGMILVAFGQTGIDLRHLALVIRAGIAGVVTAAEHVVQAVFRYAQHRRILACHPCRTRAAGRGQNGFDAVFSKVVHHFVHPAEIIHAVLRLQIRPAENADAQRVDARLARILHILFPDGFLLLHPLLRVVIAAVQKLGVVKFHILLSFPNGPRGRIFLFC